MFSLARDWEGKGQIKATLHFRDESRGSPEWQEWLVNSPPLSPPKKIEQNGVLYSGRIVLVISIFKLKLMQNTNLPHQCLNIFTNIYDMDIAVFGLLWMWLPLREKCSYSELFWSSFLTHLDWMRTRVTPNTDNFWPEYIMYSMTANASYFCVSENKMYIFVNCPAASEGHFIILYNCNLKSHWAYP